ncbi:Sec14 cytosolic factor [Hypsizygus marmoreus]|uniref:Sec14 cytosolic factor n=1 Tax=Hypsizygus marmoreus TaxID=39966 RepID=A0A369J1P9_HYPMA|nr:Sec14 cytosolic factor [Hypsizygus marmoreus]
MTSVDDDAKQMMTLTVMMITSRLRRFHTHSPMANPDSSIPVHPFAGHLGNLTASQQEALDTFKAALTKSGLYTPATDHSSVASHDDTTLLRFLRARAFNPAAARNQFADAEAWRKRHDVDALYSSFEVDEFERSKRFYPRWTGRRDKNGRPVYVYHLASLAPIQKDLDAVPADRRYQRMCVYIYLLHPSTPPPHPLTRTPHPSVALYEYMSRFAFPLCTHLPRPHPASPISSTTTIIDLHGVSFASMWSLRGHLQEASKLATANYPETLGVIAVVNSPAFFPTVWGWIKGWFDPPTRHKIHILSSDPGPTLLSLIHAPDLPRTYGGELDWAFHDEPSLCDHAREAVRGEEAPRGPVVFVDGAVARP